MPFSHRIFPVAIGQARTRFDRVNTVRTAAIVAVFCYHCFTLPFHGSVGEMQAVAETWPAWLRTVAAAGFTAVGLSYRLVGVFFMLSGFFLHRTFLGWRERNADEPWGKFTPFFLWRRFWRIVPPFWIALLFSYFVAYSEPFSANALRKLAVNATLFKTLFPGYYFSINYAHWYVAVQWQLDLLYPVFIYMVWRGSFAAAVSIACGLGLVFSLWVPALTSAAYIVHLPFVWWADWALGALIAHAHSRGRKVFSRPGLTAAAVLAGLALGYRFDLPVVLWALPRVGLALILEAAILSKKPLARWERLIAPVGICSYSIYLFHMPLLFEWSRLVTWLGHDLRRPLVWLISNTLCFILTVGFCWLSYRWIEEPSAALGARLWRRLMLPRPEVAAVPAESMNFAAIGQAVVPAEKVSRDGRD